ncbi:MAG: hypothetical protein IJY39_04855 [Clostridia bacterium]|nr:hypothetical protein [Clostridia bacterium]
MGNDYAFLISIVIFLVTVIIWSIVILKPKRDRLFTPIIWAIVGIAVASFVALLPVYLKTENNAVTAILRSIQHSIRLFVVDDGFDIFKTESGNNVITFQFIPEGFYRVWMVFLFIVAPLTTFTAILSVFVRIWYYFKNWVLKWRETHAFSELNERTLALATSIVERYNRRRETGVRIRKPLIIFADIIDKNEEAHIDLVQSAKELHAILFKKDLTSIKFRGLIKRKINFYLISEDDSEKLRHAKYVIENYDDDHTKLFLFSDSFECELFMKRYSDVSKVFSDETICAEKYFRMEYFDGSADEGKEGSEKAEETKKRKKYFKKILSAPKDGEEDTVLSAGAGFLSRKDERKTDKYNAKMRQYLGDVQRLLASSQVDKAKECLEKAKRCRLDAIRTKGLKITGIHINEIRFLVYQYLYEQGIELFADANDDGALKTVYATVIGYGKHGEEFMKALLWYCQLPGYKIDLTVIDQDETAESRFKAAYPALRTDCSCNNSDDMRYRITFKRILVGTNEFVKEITKEAENKRHFFICLGDDTLNASTCSVVERARGRLGLKTGITAIIRNIETKKLIESRDVKVIGDHKSYYSVNTFSADNSLIKSGFEEHFSWLKTEWNKIRKSDRADYEEMPISNETELLKRCSENTFNFNAYNFYSSISKAIHRRLRVQDHSLALDERYRQIFERTSTIKAAKEYAREIEDKLCTENYKNDAVFVSELRAIAEIEHIRWNAYMRTEGWIFCESPDRKNKMHSDLVSVEQLPDSKIINDI